MDCVVHRGHNYGGTVSTTVDGTACVPWFSVTGADLDDVMVSSGHYIESYQINRRAPSTSMKTTGTCRHQ